MALEIEGKLIKVLPPRSGEGRNGQWKSQDFVIETPGQYPAQACFSVWNDRVNLGEIALGETIKVQFDVRSREYQDKWYTSLSAYRIDKLSSTPVSSGGSSVTPPQGGSNNNGPTGPVEQNNGGAAGADDDLPF